MPALFLFQCELAKSGRSKCKGCSRSIDKSSLRVGVSQRREEDNDERREEEKEEAAVRSRMVMESTKWFHPMCLCKFRTSKNWWRQHLVDGFEEIGNGNGGIGEDNRLLLKLLMATLRSDEEKKDDGGQEEVRKDGKIITTTCKGGKRKKGNDEDIIVADKQQQDDEISPANKTPTNRSPTVTGRCSPKKSIKSPTTVSSSSYYSPGVVSAEELTAIETNMTSLRTKSVLQLQEMLRLNKQKIGGNRVDVVMRVSECIVLGSVPKCQSCGGGFLKFSPLTGVYSCPGYHDEDRFVSCKFTTNKVERIPWINC
eukprot:GHVS01086945.1.p1 GENE.GHVS01086945.1~~GHVS01086945.1.p1  ORF type:complete len:312 (+),score=64.86 GHVS01086945.1:20-955(+)